MTDSTRTNTAVRIVYGLLSAILLILFALSVFGETIPVNGGAGYDGEFYREVFRGFSTDFFSTGYDAFRIQRIFPFCLMNAVYSLTGIPLDNAHMINGMYTLLFLNLAFQLWLFFRLAKFQGFKPATTVILFALFFFNFPVLKNCGYEPFQTDPFAMTIALGSYLLLLKGKPAVAFAVSLLGLVTWPTVTYAMALLVLFPKREGNRLPPLPGILGRPVPRLFQFLPLAYGLAAMALVVLFYALHKQVNLEALLLSGASPKNIAIGLGMFVLITWLLAVCLKVESIPYSVSSFLRALRPKPLLGVLAGILAVSAVLHLHTNDEFFFDGKIFFLQVLIRPLKYPLVTFAGHAVCWGALFAVIIVLAKDFVKDFVERSPGHALVLLAFLFFALDSESRHIATFVPLLLPALGATLDKLDLTPKAAAYIVVVQLLLSHFYIPINVDGLAENLEALQFSTPEAQRYCMNYGPWMTVASYRSWLAVALATGLGVNEVFRHGRRPQTGK